MSFIVATGLLGALAAVPEAGPLPMERTAAEANTATVFYYTKTKNWSSTYLHYAPRRLLDDPCPAPRWQPPARTG